MLSLSLILSLCGCSILTNTKSRNKKSATRPTVSSHSTTEATTEPSTEATQPPYSVENPVETVIDYTREIVPKSGSTTILTHHKVRCPALTADTKDAREINAELYDICNDVVEELKNYQDDEYIYELDYCVTNYNGIVALVMKLGASNYYGGVMLSHKEYFFNANTGKRMTFQEYQSTLDIPMDEVQRLVGSHILTHTSNYTVLWVAADKTQTYVMISSPDTMDGFLFASLNKSVLN